MKFISRIDKPLKGDTVIIKDGVNSEIYEGGRFVVQDYRKSSVAIEKYDKTMFGNGSYVWWVSRYRCDILR